MFKPHTAHNSAPGTYPDDNGKGDHSAPEIVGAEADDSLHHDAKANENVARKEQIIRLVVTKRCNDVPVVVAPVEHRAMVG